MILHSFNTHVKIYYLAISMMLLAGCNNRSVSDPEFNYNKIADTNKQSSLVTMPGTSQQNQTTPLPLPTNTNSQAGNITLNPEHGNPGHRCEIAVGAPLNSNPVTTSNTIQTTQPTITSTTTTTPTITTQTTTAKTSANNTNAALNPAHGQPGHRCDIGVGQPLNSKPTTITQQTTQPQPVVAKTKTTTPAGMNPPHGEPGHRCDIAVGSPLNQPVKKNDTASHTPLILAPKDSAKK